MWAVLIIVVAAVGVCNANEKEKSETKEENEDKAMFTPIAFYDTINEENQSENVGNEETLIKRLITNGATVVGNKRWRNYIEEDTDSNNDGEITLEELENKYREYLNGVFDIIDEDGDKSVTIEELQGPRFDVGGARKMFNIALQFVLPDIFMSFDQNKDGVLSKDEHFMEESGGGFIEQFLPSRQEMWDTYSDFIFVFDKNKDSNITISEIKEMLQAFIQPLFGIVDQNDDELITLDDFLTINIDLKKLPGLFKQGFKSAGNQFTKVNMIEVIPKSSRRFIDTNRDGIVNLKDFYHRQFGRRLIPKIGYILAQVSRNVDKNQDGIWYKEEIQNFMITLLAVLDIDVDRHITLDDGYKILLGNGVKENQLEMIKKYVNVVKEFVKAEFTRIANQIFEGADVDKNGKMSNEEFSEFRMTTKIKVNSLPEGPEPWKVNLEFPNKILAALLDHPAFCNTYDLAQFEGLDNIETYILGLISAIIILVIALIVLLCAIIVIKCKARGNLDFNSGEASNNSDWLRNQSLKV